MSKASDMLRSTRRKFLREAILGAIAPLGLGSFASAAAATAPEDYRALVCLFLHGGNDQYNTIVPYDEESYRSYFLARGGGVENSIALARTTLDGSLLRPVIPITAGRHYALHPALLGMARLFDKQQTAIVLNVGPLEVPLTRAQYESDDLRRYPRPPKLFSHNDQMSVWQTNAPEGASAGWGGLLADEDRRENLVSPLSSVVVGSTVGVFAAGRLDPPYVMRSLGPIKVLPVSEGGRLAVALDSIIRSPRAHLMENEYNRTTRRSMSLEETVSRALSEVRDNGNWPVSELGSSLKTVFLTIAANARFGIRRQVFYIGINGYDTHSLQRSSHSALLAQLSEAITSFQSACDLAGLSKQVTLFTASEFGRTLTSNGDGTDHGWGGHHFVVGGAVRGGRFYGEAPPVSFRDSSAPEDSWHVGQGRLLPSISLVQYAATLGRWFGVSDSDLLRILPALKNFGVQAGRPDYPSDLSFLG